MVESNKDNQKWVRALAGNSEGASSDPQDPCKSTVWLQVPAIPVLGRRGRDRRIAWVCYLPAQLRTSDLVRDLSQGIKARSDGTGYLVAPLDSEHK